MGLIFGLKGKLIAAGMFLVGIIAAIGLIRRDAVKDERRRAKEADNDRANEIRDRVERGLADRVSEHNRSGWRD